MAVASTYSTGTASVNANGTAVTGQGTTWSTSGLKEGDIFWAAGLSVRIASVNSNTSITLAYPWPGGSRAADSYEVRFTPDAIRVLASAREVLDKLTNGNLYSIAGLASAADKLAYFTGAGTSALTNLKPKGRDILDTADMSGLLAKLGPVFGGAAPVPSSAGVGLADGDFNTLSYGGIYTITGAWTNGPDGAGSIAYGGLLEVRSRVFNNFYEQTFSKTNGEIWKRRTTTANAADWPTPWYRVDKTREVHELVTIADDAAYSHTFAISALGWGMIACQNGAGPTALFHFRAISPSRVNIISSINGTVNGNNGNLTLAGVTGADGALNIAANGTTLYVENRFGSSQNWLISLFGSAQ